MGRIGKSSGARIPSAMMVRRLVGMRIHSFHRTVRGLPRSDFALHLVWLELVLLVTTVIWPRRYSGAAVARARAAFYRAVLVRVAVDGEAADAEPGGDPRDGRYTCLPVLRAAARRSETGQTATNTTVASRAFTLGGPLSHRRVRSGERPEPSSAVMLRHLLRLSAARSRRWRRQPACREMSGRRAGSRERPWSPRRS
jgi:hypothetical protein